MRPFLTLTTRLLVGLAVTLAVPGRVLAQSASRVITSYYDSARTQRRAVYRVLLQGPRPDTVRQGSFRRYWPGGSLQERGHFSQGQADSVWTRYYPAAPGKAPALARRLPMQAGQPEGPFVVFYPDGRLAQRGTFRHGQLVDSLVSRTAAGRPRLLAQFREGGLGQTGEFRQWYGSLTAQPSFNCLKTEFSHSSNNPYPATDAKRYWTGQLGGGRLVGNFTEWDADAQPRVRLLFDSVGCLQAVTSYYPAAWLRHELIKLGTGGDTLYPRSQPALERRVVGHLPWLLQRTWDWESWASDSTYHSSNSPLGSTALFEALGGARYSGPSRCGSEDSAVMARPLTRSFMDEVSRAASFWAWVPRRRLPGLPSPNQPCLLGQWASLPTGLLPASYRARYWAIGETDTLTGAYRLLERRELRAPTGQLVAVETPHGHELLMPSGKVYLESRKKKRAVITRYYSENGRLQSEYKEKGRMGMMFSRHRGRRTGLMPPFRTRVKNPKFR